MIVQEGLAALAACPAGATMSIGNFDGVHVGHRAILHGCSLGEAVLVGMGATVLNGATLGPECLVGAASLVTEGRDVPPRSLVLGAPARVVRPLDEAEVGRLHASARAYVETARRHAGGLSAVGGPGR